MAPNQLVDVVMMLFTYVGMSKDDYNSSVIFFTQGTRSCKNNNYFKKETSGFFLFFNLMLSFKNIYFLFFFRFVAYAGNIERGRERR